MYEIFYEYLLIFKKPYMLSQGNKILTEKNIILQDWMVV